MNQDSRHHTELNAGSSDPTDGRKPYEWDAKYPHEAISQIRLEAVYLAMAFLISFLVIFITWREWLCYYLSVRPGESNTLNRYVYYCASGMLGGTIFDIKFLYRSVARGYWHRDRRIWRFFVPWISMALAFIVGALIEANLFTTRKTFSAASFVSIGFIVGYFADHTFAKMYDIAGVFFGRTVVIKDRDGK